jgi:serine/threonine protein kinase
MALDHANVIRIIECFEHDDKPVIAMEVLRGLSLTDYLKQETKLAIQEVAGIFLRVTSAVGTAHALGLVHRDLKPDNIFLLEVDPFVKVLDFGIAKMRKGAGLEESAALTRTGMLIGTPYYMSPEQAFGDKSIDQRSDIWSLGLMMHQALTGVLATQGDSLHEVFSRLMTHKFDRLDQIDPSIPTDVGELVDRMLSRDREARPFDLREVFEVLSRHVGDTATVATSFEAAAPPISLDEPSSKTVALEQPPAHSAPVPKAEPLKFTPQSLKRSDPGHGGLGTVILEVPPASKSVPKMGAGARDTASIDADVNQPASRPSSSKWMWVVAVIVIAGCIALLASQLQ